VGFKAWEVVGNSLVGTERYLLGTLTISCKDLKFSKEARPLELLVKLYIKSKRY